MLTDYVIAKGYKSVQRCIELWVNDREIIQKALMIDCSDKLELINWVTKHNHNVARLAYIIINISALEELWEHIINSDKEEWILWLAYSLKIMERIESQDEYKFQLRNNSKMKYRELLEYLKNIKNPFKNVK